MEFQATLYTLNAIIQGNIVILTVVGTFVTFIIAFTWQHSTRARRLISKEEKLRKNAVSKLNMILGQYHKRIKKVYESWFLDNPQNTARFFDHIVFNHSTVNRYRTATTILSPLLLFFGLLARTALLFINFVRKIRGSDSGSTKKKLLETVGKGSGRIALLMGSYLAISSIKTAWQCERGIPLPFLSFNLFLLALIRGAPPIGEFRRKPKSTHVKGIATAIDLVDVFQGEIKQDLLEWAALHESTEFFPEQLLFPTKLGVPPGARTLGYEHFSMYGKEEQSAFDAAKRACLSNDHMKKITSIGRDYGQQKKELEKFAKKIGQVDTDISSLSFFVRPEGRKKIKGLVIWLTIFTVIDIFWSFLIMKNVSLINYANTVGVGISLLFMVITIALLISLISVLLKAL